MHVVLSLFDMKWYRLRAQYLSTLVWLAPGAEATLERASETSPVWCGHKDILHLNKRNPFQEKEKEAAVVNGVANPSPAPALIALNIFKALIWKNESPALTR